MCFSATASFAAAAVMTGIGTVSVIHNKSRSHRMLAMIPLLFSAQQAAEGVVWRTIGQSADAVLCSIAVNLFLGFALIVWPLWLPVSLLLMEKDLRRRRLIQAVVWIGAAVSACGASVLVFWPPVAAISQHSIGYSYPQVANRVVLGGFFLLYLVPAVLPTFLSTMNMARWIGSVLLASLITTIIVNVNTLTSVWCFFSTALSCLIVLSTFRRQRSARATIQSA